MIVYTFPNLTKAFSNYTEIQNYQKPNCYTTNTVKAAFSKSVICNSIVLNSTRHPTCFSLEISSRPLLGCGGFHRTCVVIMIILDLNRDSFAFDLVERFAMWELKLAIKYCVKHTVEEQQQKALREATHAPG